MSGPAKFPEREGQEIEPNAGGVHLVEGGENEREGEEDRVVQEGLADEERQPQNRATWVLPEHHPAHFDEADRSPLAHLDGVLRLGERLSRLPDDLPLDIRDDLIGLFRAPMCEKPPGALRDEPAHEQDGHPEHGTDAEAKPPAEVRRNQVGVEQHERGRSSDRSAEPVRPVHEKVDRAAHPCGYQLVDGGVDGRVLPSDAHTGQEPEDEEPPRVERGSRQQRGNQVEPERDEKEPLSPVTVRQMTKEQRADACAGDVDAGGVPDLGRCDRDTAVALRDRAADRADDGDFEPVEYPDGPETHQDEPMPLGPGKSVEAGRDVCLDDGAIVALVLGELAACQLHRAHTVRSADGASARTFGGAASVEATGVPASEVGTVLTRS